MNKNNIFDSFQSGSRSQHSTETALVKVTNDLLLSVDSGNCTALVLLDLRAAFDTVDHGILLDRLSQWAGIRGTVLEWFIFTGENLCSGNREFSFLRSAH